MAYKNGINGHRALVVKNEDINYYDHKTFSLNQIKSKTFLKNGYKYVRLQGVYYTVKTNRAWSKAPLTVWLGEKATLLLIDEKSMKITIIDNGCGIPAGKIDKIFERIDS